MVARINTIREKLSDLQNVDRELKRYGAWQHKYAHGPTLSDAKLLRFESQHNVNLPNEYRSYLSKIGNGGAGPGNGIMTFPNGDGRDSMYTKENLNIPFLFDAPYRCWEHNDDDLELHQLDETCGTIRLAHYGCAIFAFLILNGEFENQIWFWEPNGDTFQPELDQAYPVPSGFPTIKTPFTFFDWYENWLDISLFECEIEANAKNGG